MGRNPNEKCMDEWDECEIIRNDNEVKRVIGQDQCQKYSSERRSCEQWWKSNENDTFWETPQDRKIMATTLNCSLKPNRMLPEIYTDGNNRKQLTSKIAKSNRSYDHAGSSFRCLRWHLLGRRKTSVSPCIDHPIHFYYRHSATIRNWPNNAELELLGTQSSFTSMANPLLTCPRICHRQLNCYL